jgi:fatty acid desaturase
LPFARLLGLATVALGIPAALLFVPGIFRWWLAVAYLAIWGIFFLGPFTLCLHNVSHRPLFKARYRRLRQIVPWVWGPLFGQTPESYYAHHMGMHHAEGNMPDDTSSTMAFQRDSWVDFLRYWGRFTLIGTWELGRYLITHRKGTLLWRFLVTEALYVATVVVLLAFNWRATLTVLVIPLVMIRFLMLAGNWGQHAFVDAADPANSYLNSITCINSPYNRKCFNDGYHIGHHVNMSRHWTEMPGDFEKNVDEYVRQRAIVFQGIDFNGVWACLMLKRYDWLARRYLDLAGSGVSEQQIVALLKERTRAIPAVAGSLQTA